MDNVLVRARHQAHAPDGESRTQNSRMRIAQVLAAEGMRTDGDGDGDGEDNVEHPHLEPTYITHCCRRVATTSFAYPASRHPCLITTSHLQSTPMRHTARYCQEKISTAMCAGWDAQLLTGKTLVKAQSLGPQTSSLEYTALNPKFSIRCPLPKSYPRTLVSLTEIPAVGRTNIEMTQPEMLEQLHKVVVPGGSGMEGVDDWIMTNIEDNEERRK